MRNCLRNAQPCGEDFQLDTPAHQRQSIAEMTAKPTAMTATTVKVPRTSRNLLKRLLAVRERSEQLINPLEPEDLCLQGMADASPPKWHLAHTTWFFEALVLLPYMQDYSGADPSWSYLFNSYYDSLGSRHPRPQRGLLTRPTIDEVMSWRHHVNRSLQHLLEQRSPRDSNLHPLIELGIQHEQQHQELLLMDLLDGFSRQPIEPAYNAQWPQAKQHTEPAFNTVQSTWLNLSEGLFVIGLPQIEAGDETKGSHQSIEANDPFRFDNETPSHRQWLEAFQLADQLITNAEYRAFIADGGYLRPELWMSEGWQIRNQEEWQAPRYWRGNGPASEWKWEFTLAGRQPLDPKAPVRHISWFEADAYARWAQARLPTEAEWEVAASQVGHQLRQLHNVLWQWTASPYRPYPGFKPCPGAISEYNGKFMSSQFVLRGSSALTPPGHCRDTYRNFFSPASRWMASGIRLAR